MPAAAVPVAASLAGPAIADAVLPAALSAAVPAWLSSAAGGAMAGGIGSYLMGQNPLKGALLGGAGAGIGSATGLTDSINGAFGAGAGAGAVPPVPALNPLTGVPVAAGAAPAAAAAPSLFSQYGMPLAFGAASLASSSMQKPQGTIDLPQKDQSSVKARPIQRNYTPVDPQSYATSGGNRDNFGGNVNPLVQYYAKGGKVDKSQKRINNEDAMMRRAQIDGHPMTDAADFVTKRYMSSDYPGDMSHYMDDEYGDVPITRLEKRPRRYANGGSSMASSMNIPVGKCYAKGGGIGRYISGDGDGRSDSIPALLSDGEFVISAPAVAAIGKGSNKAGAKKLDKMHKEVLRKSYKGKTPFKGVGSYMGAMQ